MNKTKANDTKHEEHSQSPIAGRLKTSTRSNMHRFGRRVKTQTGWIQTDSIECSIIYTKTATPYTKQDGDRYTDQPHKKVNSSPTRSLEAFSVHNSRTGIIILVLGDPHLLEGGQ